jgi:hypothetical protein
MSAACFADAADLSRWLAEAEQRGELRASRRLADRARTHPPGIAGAARAVAEPAERSIEDGSLR